ncbi:MAG: SEL1-like repeat protein [Woeseiaceae bacterium]
MKIRLALISGLLAGVLCTTVIAQTYRPFPGETVDQRTRYMQERVEAIYAAGNHDRALLIYENDLAPIGDKYAQYMVGYMHLQGEGVQRDRAEALAWFRLAAERGEPLLTRIRDEVLQQMSAVEISASDNIYLELWKSIGDHALIMELIREDMNILRAQTGTRIPGGGTTGSTVILRPSGEIIGPNFYRNVRARLDARIAYLDARVEISDELVADELERIRIQEIEVKEELSAMGNR